MLESLGGLWRTVADAVGTTTPVLAAVTLVGFVWIAVLANLITLPGNWAVVAASALYAWAGPDDGRVAMTWFAVAAVFVLALVGEGVEFMAGAAGARKAGASRKSTLYAIVGSMIGAIGGAVVGVPIPIIGSFIAAILFGGLGAMSGAMYGEWTDGRRWRDSWSIGHAAFWGRTLGVLGKLVVGGMMAAVVTGGVLI